MNFYRILFVLAILIPYKLYFTLNKTEVSIWIDMLVAIIAFGTGYALFPDKKRNKNDSNTLDQN